MSLCLTNQVQLTWDETDHDRVTALNRNFNKHELLDMDFNAYLASSSEEEEEEGEEGGIEFGDDDNTAEGETVTGDTFTVESKLCWVVAGSLFLL